MIFRNFARGWALTLLVVLTACAGTQVTEKPGLSPVAFQDVPGWEADHQAEALPALEKSCRIFLKKSSEQRLVLPEAGSVGDWQDVCRNLPAKDNRTDEVVRRYFEDHFIPYAVKAQAPGLFTGYYEAQLNGSLKPSTRFMTPLWQKPDDLLTVDLGAFKPELQGQKIVGKAEGHKFVPYDNRAAVTGGSIEGRAKPLVWVDNPVDAFFLEIQGSGRVRMDNGDEWRVGYEAQNGRAYEAIGRILARDGAIEKPVTMAKIREWLAAHPDRAVPVLNFNPSVVFFRRLKGEGPVGAQGVALTPLRSLAVDPRFVPLGVPLFLATTTQHRLVVAQDTGGAIKGPVRGDLFWGYGAEAEAGAGVMQESGTYYLLLPKKAARP